VLLVLFTIVELPVLALAVIGTVIGIGVPIGIIMYGIQGKKLWDWRPRY
jgi:hypothetical protein